MPWTLTETAQRILGDIRYFGERRFGERTADDYDLLIRTALDRIAADPACIGVRRVPRARGVFAYHLEHSRDAVPRERRIERPRHRVVFRVGDDGSILVLGFVRDEALLARAARRFEREADDR